VPKYTRAKTFTRTRPGDVFFTISRGQPFELYSLFLNEFSPPLEVIRRPARTALIVSKTVMLIIWWRSFDIYVRGEI
jgi:hypothetical protein